MAYKVGWTGNDTPTGIAVVATASDAAAVTGFESVVQSTTAALNRVRVQRFTTDGTGAAATIPEKTNSRSAAPPDVYRQGYATTEPTYLGNYLVVIGGACTTTDLALTRSWVRPSPRYPILMDFSEGLGFTSNTLTIWTRSVTTTSPHEAIPSPGRRRGRRPGYGFFEGNANVMSPAPTTAAGTTFRAAGAKSAGVVAALTVSAPTGVAVGDLEVLVATSIFGGTVSINNNGGGAWTSVIAPPSVSGGGILYVWWRIRASGDTDPQVTPTTSYVCACRLAYSNFDATTPIEIAASSTEATSDTSFSWAPGTSTTVNDAHVVCISTSGTDSNVAQVPVCTDASLTSLTSLANYETNSGGGGGFGITEGTKATAGTVGTFACTYATASPKSYVSFAVRPGAAVSDPPISNTLPFGPVLQRSDWPDTVVTNKLAILLTTGTTAVSTTALLPFEWQQAAAATSLDPLEWQQGEIASARLEPFEWQQAAMTTSLEPLEWTGYVAATSLDPLEWVGSVARALLEPLEWQNPTASALLNPLEWQQAAMTTSLEPVEWSGFVGSSGLTPLEWLNLAVASGLTPLESLAAAVSARLDPLEWLQAVAASGLGPLEWSGAVASPLLLPIEWSGLAAVAQTAQVILEWQQGVAQTSQSPLESLAAAVSPLLLPAEWTQGGVASARVTPVEWLNLAAQTGLTPFEWAVGVAAAIVAANVTVLEATTAAVTATNVAGGVAVTTAEATGVQAVTVAGAPAGAGTVDPAGPNVTVVDPAR